MKDKSLMDRNYQFYGSTNSDQGKSRTENQIWTTDNFEPNKSSDQI